MERSNDSGPAEDQSLIFLRRRPFRRIALFIALGLLLVLVAAIAVLWIERRPIATHYLKGEFERRGVTASYHLDRVGLRTQEVSNLVIGDPRRPDLVARFAHIETRLKRMQVEAGLRIFVQRLEVESAQIIQLHARRG